MCLRSSLLLERLLLLDGSHGHLRLERLLWLLHLLEVVRRWWLLLLLLLLLLLAPIVVGVLLPHGAGLRRVEDLVIAPEPDAVVTGGPEMYRRLVVHRRVSRTSRASYVAGPPCHLAISLRLGVQVHQGRSNSRLDVGCRLLRWLRLLVEDLLLLLLLLMLLLLLTLLTYDPLSGVEPEIC